MNVITKGMQVFFESEKAPMKVIILNQKFAICTRKLHRWYDAKLLKYDVEMRAYWTFTEAYNAQKDEMVYSIIDFDKMKRGPHNLVFNNYDFKDLKSINELLEDLTKGEVELSKRHSCNLVIDWNKTISS